MVKAIIEQSNGETGKWKGAPDDLFARLAEVYGMPLSSFVKNQGVRQ
jgi:hypothetical protein